MERYDPSRDRWDEVAPLSSPRRCVAVGCLGGRLYAVGGSGSYTRPLPHSPYPASHDFCPIGKAGTIRESNQTSDVRKAHYA